MPRLSAIDVLFHPGRCDAAAELSAGAIAAPRAGSPATRQSASPEQVLETLDAAAVDCVFISQCKQWSCERQWMCLDTRLEDVLRFTRHSPRFLGLAGYNPFDMVESLREIEVAATLGFRGVYLHAASFGLPLGDARFYPLFAKSAELALPVVVQLGIAEPVLAATVKRVCKDIPELTLTLAQPRPDPVLMQALAADCENVAFVLDPAALACLARAATLSTVEAPGFSPAKSSAAADGLQPWPVFFASPIFAERCCWASNGATLADALAAAQALPVPPETLARFLALNAARVFALEEPVRPRTPQSLASEVALAER